MKIQTLLMVPLLLLSSCSSLERSQSSNSKPMDTTLNLAIGMDQELNLEPCGCSFNPLGGMERNWQLLKEKRATTPNLKYVTGGVNLTDPMSATPRLKHQKIKVATLVENYNLMGLEMMALSQEDLSQPNEVLSVLKEKAKFALISTNVRAQKVLSDLPTNWHLSTKDGEVVFFSLSSKPSKKSSLRWENPSAALKRELAALNGDTAKFLIVFSDFDNSTRIAMAKAFPQINLWVGEKKGTIADAFIPEKPNQLFLNLKSAGKQLGFISLKLKPDFNELYSEEKAELYAPLLKEWQEQANVIQRSLSDNSKADEKSRLETEKEYAAQRIHELSLVPLKASEKSATYQSSVVYIDKKIEARMTADNPVLANFEKYKAEIQKLGIQE